MSDAIALGGDGKGLFDGVISGTGVGDVPVHQVDLSTDAVTTRTDDPGPGGGQVFVETAIARSADRSLIAFREPNGPVFTYHAASDAFSPSFDTQMSIYSPLLAVSRNGTLIAMQMYYPAVSVIDTSYGHVKELAGIDGGVIFDPTQDVLYGVNTSTEQIVAYDTSTWAVKYTLPVGENVPAVPPVNGGSVFGNGVMAASADGRYLFLATPAGVRQYTLPVAVGPASQFIVSGFPTPATAGTAGSVTVTAEDAQGHVVSGYTGTVHFSSDPLAQLPADYTFTAADAGTHTISVTLRTPGSQSITATDTASSTVTGSQPGITVNPAGVMGTGSAITAVEGTPFTNSVAAFTDPGGAEPVANYSATIDWGEGISSTGTITFAGTPGSTTDRFALSGNHPYKEEGAYTVTATLHHLTAPTTVVTATATVSDPAVVGTGVNWTANQGVAFTGQTVATFTDPGGAEPLADYAATIDWGDGSTSAGTITGPASGVFTVSGGHSYAAAGTYTVHVTLRHDNAPNTVVSSTAVVSATHLAVTTQPPASVTAGSGFGLAVSAEDPNGNLLTGFTGGVTVALASNPGGSTLGGTLTVTAVNGVATFSGLTLDKGGNGYTLQATSAGLAPTTTNPFSVTAVALSAASVYEFRPAGTVVGTFTSAEPGSHTFTYALVSGVGSADNGSFTVQGNQRLRHGGGHQPGTQRLRLPVRLGG